MKNKYEKLEDLLKKAENMSSEEYNSLYNRTRNNPHFEKVQIIRLKNTSQNKGDLRIWH